MHTTAICPTYGRFELLRAAVGCFLRQTHDNCDLLILNDAPVPIECNIPRVRVLNETGFDSLGAKYARLLDVAAGPIIAHWEDDDLYLPWHLEAAAEAMSPIRRIGPISVIKPRLSWCLIWNGTGWGLGGRSSRLCEGSTVYHRATWRMLGGYVHEHSTHSRRALARAEEAGVLERYTPRPCTSYVFCRLHPGIRHGSGLCNMAGGKERYESGNKDFGLPAGKAGDGRELTPVFDDGRMAAFRRDIPQRVAPHEADAILAALSTTEAAKNTEVRREE